MTANRGAISLYATMLFVWFSTRLFASVRTGLNRIYHLAAPAHRERHFLIRMLLNKVWDAVMVGVLLLDRARGGPPLGQGPGHALGRGDEAVDHR